MRLAEVYLIAAEANAYLGNTAEAVRLVNIILERARNSKDGAPSGEPAAWNTSDFADAKSLVTAIFWERCFEMPFEHHEGYRTMYFGKANVYDEDPSLVRKGLLSAYPYDELVYNPYLDETVHDPNYGQNPEVVWWK